MKERIHSVDVFLDVYPPGEDTFLLMDSLEADSDDVAVDMGSGTGYISIHLLDKVRKLVAVDIQFPAVKNTLANIKDHVNAHRASVTQSDLFQALSPSFKASLIAFNPPYLPKDNENETSMDSSLVGGMIGTELSERFVEQCTNHLEPNGSVYLIASSLSNMEGLMKFMKRLGFVCDVVKERTLFFEKLAVIRGTL